MTISTLRKLRVEKGYSQLELSRLSRVAPNIICAIEKGKLYPFPGWRARIAAALGIDEVEIFPKEELKKNNVI